MSILHVFLNYRAIRPWCQPNSKDILIEFKTKNMKYWTINKECQQKINVNFYYKNFNCDTCNFTLV